MIKFINLKKDEPLKANAVNLASFANALCHFNATPLSVAVLAPYAWSKNLACGGAWQSVLLGRNGAWQGVVKLATHNTANSAWQMFAGEAGKAKMGQCLGGGLLSLSLSLSRCSHFLAHLCVQVKGLFYSFCRSFFSSYRKFFLFHRSFNSSFCLQKAFFRALCFFEIFKCFVFWAFCACHCAPFS